jgi:hypothetical protein
MFSTLNVGFRFKNKFFEARNKLIQMQYYFTDYTLLIIVNYFPFSSSSALNCTGIKMCPALSNVMGCEMFVYDIVIE